MTEPKLKPCPFCGEDKFLETFLEEKPPMWIKCKKFIGGCGMEGPVEKTKKRAIQAWNRRTECETK